MITLEKYGIWVSELETIPEGYGVAWYSIWSMRAFCMRIPFNRILGSFRAFYLEFQRPCEDDPVLLAYRKGSSEGEVRGYRRGYEIGLRLSATLAEIREEIEAFKDEM